VKITVALLALFLLLKPIFPVVDYVVNYDYISKVLCVNKEKPKLSCNGKCHLMKELAKASDHETPISSHKKNTTSEFEILFFQTTTSFQVGFANKLNKLDLSNCYTNLYAYNSSFSLFHPPNFLS